MFETESEQPDVGQPLRRLARRAMACTFEVALLEQDAAYAEQAARAALAEADRLELELSRFVPTSDVSRINALAPGEVVQVGVETLDCLKLAATVYAETGGAFDITFAGAAAPDAAPPLLLAPDSRSVGVSAAGVRIDLGGIGKGYAVDRIAEVLREWSIGAALIHSGQSTVFALGRPAAAAWRIAIRDPEEGDASLGQVHIADAALSGSGRLLQGDHIVDPRRGRPVEDRLGAWAIAPSAALSDTLSTAFMVMSPDEIEAYCRRHEDVSALIISPAANQRRVVTFGPGFRSLES